MKKININRNSKRKVSIKNSIGFKIYRTDFFKIVLKAPKMPTNKTIPKVSDIIINNTKYYKRRQHSVCAMGGISVSLVIIGPMLCFIPFGNFGLSGSIVSYMLLMKS